MSVLLWNGRKLKIRNTVVGFITVYVVHGQPIGDWSVERSVDDSVQEDAFLLPRPIASAQLNLEIALFVMKWRQDQRIRLVKDPRAAFRWALDGAASAEATDLVPLLKADDSAPLLVHARNIANAEDIRQ